MVSFLVPYRYGNGIAMARRQLGCFPRPLGRVRTLYSIYAFYIRERKHRPHRFDFKDLAETRYRPQSSVTRQVHVREIQRKPLNYNSKSHW